MDQSEWVEATVGEWLPKHPSLCVGLIKTVRIVTTYKSRSFYKCYYASQVVVCLLMLSRGKYV